MSKLVLKNIGKTYGNFHAVNDFSLELQSGEFVSLLGPSGCGKTTTLRMIAGFMPPTSGTIEIDGQVISSPAGVVPPEKRGMSMIFQSYAIWPNMTVAQNVGFGLGVRKVPAAEMRQRVDRMLEVVKLGALAQRYPAELSGGQQQRVAVGRALLSKPSIIFADEPTGNLDSRSGAEILTFMRKAVDELGQTIVMVTHDPIAASYADRVVFLADGAIVDELHEANADTIIDKMKSLGG